MSFFRTIVWIARRECADHFRNRWLLSILLVTGLLLPLSLYGGRQELAARLADHQTRAAQLDGERQLAFRHAGSGLIRELRILRAPNRASAVVRGIDASSPQFWDVEPAGLTAGYDRAELTGVYAAGTSLDLELLARWLLGLAAVLLGVDAMARARRSGLLKTLLTYPVSPRAIALGKLSGGAATAAVLTLFLMVAATLSSLALLPEGAAADGVVAAWSIAGAAWLYLCVMFATGAVAGIVARTTDAATVVALTLWLAFAVLAVPTVGLLSRALAPAAARGVFEATRDAVYQQSVSDAQRRLGGIFREWIGPTGSTRDVPFEGELRHRLESEWERRVGAIRAELDAIEANQTHALAREKAVADALKFLSPGALFLEAATTFAGTGTIAADRMMTAGESYQNDLESAVFDQDRPRLHLRIPGPRGESAHYYDRRQLPKGADLPQFTPAADTPRQRLLDAAPSMAGLAAYAMGLGLAAVLLFRYRRDGRSDRP